MKADHDLIKQQHRSRSPTTTTGTTRRPRHQPQPRGPGRGVSPANLLNRDQFGAAAHFPHLRWRGFVSEHTVWFGMGKPARKPGLWTKSVQRRRRGLNARAVAFGDGANSAATTSTKFFYDFACPYGSQPEACRLAQGLKEYQETMDELEQPSGPLSPTALTRTCLILSAAGRRFASTVGGRDWHGGSEDLQYCALPTPWRTAFNHGASKSGGDDVG